MLVSKIFSVFRFVWRTFTIARRHRIRLKKNRKYVVSVVIVIIVVIAFFGIVVRWAHVRYGHSVRAPPSVDDRMFAVAYTLHTDSRQRFSNISLFNDCRLPSHCTVTRLSSVSFWVCWVLTDPTRGRRSAFNIDPLNGFLLCTWIVIVDLTFLKPYQTYSTIFLIFLILPFDIR